MQIMEKRKEKGCLTMKMMGDAQSCVGIEGGAMRGDVRNNSRRRRLAIVL